MCDELHEEDIESLPLPKDWVASVRHAVLNVVGIVRLAMLSGRELLIQEGDVAQAQVHRLVAVECSGSFFKAFDGFRRIQNAAGFRRSNGSVGPRHPH